MPIVFAAFSPHAPIFLPWQGVKGDHARVKKTLKNLRQLGENFKKADPESIIISSPHPDWGFKVPLYFLAKGFKGEIEQHLTASQSPVVYFEEGKKVYQGIKNLEHEKGKRIALIASGDTSHRLAEEGPYGFHPQGPDFDEKLIDALRAKDIKTILRLGEMYPEAAECGLRSFCFLLGILEASEIKWQPEVLSYEGPFGVGYLTVNFKLNV
ncbi:MAG: class III extradiol dioxygenase subunit B-like domain-containing protein [bacterium]|nr:class III extradiol dioxygenase subunit B-like domain-containing protein [bacterium]